MKLVYFWENILFYFWYFWKNKNKKKYFYFFIFFQRWENNFELFLRFFEKIIWKNIIFSPFWKNKNNKNYFYFFKSCQKWENNSKLFPRFFEKIIWKNIIFSIIWSEKIIFFYFLGKIQKIISNYFLPAIMLEHLWSQTGNYWKKFENLWINLIMIKIKVLFIAPKSSYFLKAPF